MAPITNGSEDQKNNSGYGSGNEVHIIIRDGKVICFEQKNRGTALECMYGDGI